MEDPKLVFRISDGQALEYLRQVCLERGWDEYDKHYSRDTGWNMWWSLTRFNVNDYRNVQSWQRLNHFAKSSGITKKDSLARNLRRMKAVHGSYIYNFSPISFNLPLEHKKYVAEYTRLQQLEDPRQILWICKPADLSRGRGIFIFRELSDCRYDCNTVVQRYITNPLLISGYKFDLRVYVVVPCYDPITIYIYEEGLVRFSTAKYNLDSLTNLYSHLTNTSLNKNSPAYLDHKDKVGYGCKWKLSALFIYFKQNNIDASNLWPKIVNLVILTIIMQIPQVPKYNNCFELFGFDILLDDRLKPWLLEVNFSPSLAADTDLDVNVKKPLLNDIIDMLQFDPLDSCRGGYGDASPDPELLGAISRSLSCKQFKDCYCFVLNDQVESSEPLSRIQDFSESHKLPNKQNSTKYRVTSKVEKQVQSRSINVVIDTAEFCQNKQLGNDAAEQGINESDNGEGIEHSRQHWDELEKVDNHECDRVEGKWGSELNKVGSRLCPRECLLEGKNDLCYFDCADFHPVIVPKHLGKQVALFEKTADGCDSENNKYPKSHSEPNTYLPLPKSTSNLSANSLDIKHILRIKQKQKPLSVQRRQEYKKTARANITSHLNKQPRKRQIVTSQAPLSYGQLQLIYPFNEVTKKLPSTEIREIVRETHKKLRAQLNQKNRCSSIYLG